MPETLTCTVQPQDGAAVTCSSRRQKCVALLTTECGPIAASERSREAVWLHHLMVQIGADQENPTTVNCGIKSAIALAHNPEHHTRSKHIDVRFHYIREQIINKEIKIRRSAVIKSGKYSFARLE